MRNMFSVLQQMLNVIPNGLDIKFPLEELMKHIKQHASYTPPECMGSYWNQLTGIINMYICAPLTEEWEFMLISIFTDKTVEALKAEQSERMKPSA